MGKSKDDNKLKRSSPSSSRGEDETRRKRHRSKDDDKKHKSKRKDKSHKISKRSKDKKSSGKHKNKARKHDLSNVNFHKLSNDDYFSKNNEFATWLKEERNIFFSDLSSETSRSLFSEFIKDWNNQELEPQYYEGIATGPRTSHKWNIKR